MIVIPIGALLIASTMSAGGTEVMLGTLESAVRHTLAALVEVVRQLF